MICRRRISYYFVWQNMLVSAAWPGSAAPAGHGVPRWSPAAPNSTSCSVANYLWRDESRPPLLSIQSLLGDRSRWPRTSAPIPHLLSADHDDRLSRRTCASATRRRDRREWPPKLCCGRLRRPRKIMALIVRRLWLDGFRGDGARDRLAELAGGPSGRCWDRAGCSGPSARARRFGSPTKPRRWPADRRLDCRFCGSRWYWRFRLPSAPFGGSRLA